MALEIFVNIGWGNHGNGLLPGGAKQFTDPVLT